jgi:hypothetical protein
MRASKLARTLVLLVAVGMLGASIAWAFSRGDARTARTPLDHGPGMMWNTRHDMPRGPMMGPHVNGIRIGEA